MLTKLIKECLNEAAKLGFKRALVPKSRCQMDGIPPTLKLIEVRNLAEALAVGVEDKK